MAKFKDTAGQEWELRLTVGALGAIREVGFNLAAMTKTGERWVEVLFADPLALARAVWILCREQAEKAGITEAKFLDDLDGLTITRAGDAMIEAIVDFFHPRQAETIKASLPKILAKIDTKTQTETAKAIDSALSD